jgi:integrase/recombinase XerC
MSAADSQPLIEEFDDYLLSWRRILRGLSPATFKSYTRATEMFRQWLSTEDGPEIPEPIARPNELAGIKAAHIYAWVNHLASLRDEDGKPALTPATINNRYRGLQQFLKFLTKEEVLAAHPMQGMTPPTVPEKHVPTVDKDNLRKLLRTCSGRDFVPVRDAAILSLYIDSGARLSEVAGLGVEDIDLAQDVAYATGKGNRPRVLSFGDGTGAALERYLRARKRLSVGDEPALWLSGKRYGTPLRHRPLSPNAMHQMLKRRCADAEIPELHMHLFRHTAATQYLDDGGQESELMRLMGWSSRQMVERYTNTTAVRRAVAAHKKLSLVDQL